MFRRQRMLKRPSSNGVIELLDGGGFDSDLNSRFAAPAREKADYHRSATDRLLAEKADKLLDYLVGRGQKLLFE